MPLPRVVLLGTPSGQIKMLQDKIMVLQHVTNNLARPVSCSTDIPHPINEQSS